MRLLFDHNVPARLERLLPEHDVTRADRAGWAALTNGILLQAAEAAGFEVMVTADKRIRYQQNLAGRTISLLVLPTPNLVVLQEGLALIQDALGRVTQGSYQEVSLPRPPLRRRPPPARPG